MAAAQNIDFSKLDDGLSEDAMREALESKRKELARFKKNTENKEKHAAKVAAKKREAEEAAQKKKEENEEKVERLRAMRRGVDPDDDGLDMQEAYTAFSALDVDASGRISLRELQRYLAGDADYFYEATFSEADVGFIFECTRPGEVYVKEIESHSPAAAHPDTAVGLKLLTFNDQKFDISHLPQYKEWPETKKCEETIRWLIHLVKADESGTYVYKFLEPKYVFNEYNNIIDIDVEKVGLKTVEIPPSAYNTHEDMILQLQTAFRGVPKLGKFKVTIDRDSLQFTFDSGGPEFRLLWETGPNKNLKAGPVLGFKNVDTDWDDQHTGEPMCLDLNMMLTADQVTIFTLELVKEVDDSSNAFIEFNEFTVLYDKYLSSDKKKDGLVNKAVERFLSAQQKEERKQVLIDKKKRKKRLKAQIKAREKQRAIAKAQAAKRKGVMKRDADGVLRQHHQHEVDPNFVPPKPPTPPPPREKTQSEIEEEKVREAQKEKKRKQAEKLKKKEEELKEAMKQQELENAKTKEWQERQNKLQLSMLGLESLVEDAVTQDYHPATMGFIMKKETKEDPELINPMYFGFQTMKLGEGKPGGLKQGANYKKYVKFSHAKIDANEKAYVKETPVAPITSGGVRQRYKDWGERYDNQEVVHPAMFGQMTLRKGKFNPEHISPVFFGYLIFKKPIFLEEGKDKDEDGADGKKMEPKECLICYVRKPGCPLCWDFPEDYSFADYAYEGPKRAAQVESDSDEDEEKPEIHTSLTTTNALKLYRGVNQHWLTLYIKTVPCGQIVKMDVEKNWTVSDLYENFRSASMYGSTRDCFLFLPTENGVFSFDNEDLPETDTTNAVTTGRVPLARYNFTRNNATLVLLHFQFYSELTTSINIKGYLSQNLNLFIQPKTHIIGHTDFIPKDLPGNDQVQKQLKDLMKLTIQQDTKIRQEDLDADNAEIATKIKFKVDEIKEKLLLERKKKAEELRLMREERRERERTERNKDFKKTYKDILRREKEENERLEAERVAEEKRKAGMLGSLKSGFIGSLTKLPGIKISRPFSREKNGDEGSGRVSPVDVLKSGRSSPILQNSSSLIKSMTSSIKIPPINLGMSKKSTVDKTEAPPQG